MTNVLVTIQPNQANRSGLVILSAAKNPASVAPEARSFAALKMTAVRAPRTAKPLPIFPCAAASPGRPPDAGETPPCRPHRGRSPRRGISLLELTVTSGLTMFLGMLLSTTWVLLNRPTADLIAWGQLFQEMDLATASIARDLGGGLSDYANAAGQLGTKQQGALLACRRANDYNGDHLQLCFDGQNPTGQASWNPPVQTIIDYYVAAGTNVLTRWNQASNPQTFFAVAKDVAAMQVVDNGGSTLQITLTFTYQPPQGTRTLTRSCNLTVPKNP